MNDNAYILSPQEQADIANKVYEGARALDRADAEWYWKIELEDLNLKYGHSCILGQLYDSFWAGKGKLGWSREHADAMGVFIVNDDELPDNQWIAYYDEMQECWIGEIADRRTDKILANL